MENNNDYIQLKLTEDKIIDIDSNTPDMLNIINEIISIKDSIDINAITISCPTNTKFDKEGFENMIKEVIESYLEEIKIEKDTFDSVVKKIKE